MQKEEKEKISLRDAAVASQFQRKQFKKMFIAGQDKKKGPHKAVPEKYGKLSYLFSSSLLTPASFTQTQKSSIAF